MQVTTPFLLFIACFYFSTMHPQFTLVLDPAGDMHNPGRKLSDSFERGATMQCVEALKEQLEQLFSSADLHIVITRSSGTRRTQEQKAQLSNRLNADLYLHISFFHETDVQPRLFVYQFGYGNDFPTPPNNLLFCPYDQAHCIALERTKKTVHQFYRSLSASTYAVQPVSVVPYAPLKGITAPAVGIEIGLHTTRAWRQCIEPLAETIAPLIRSSCVSPP